MADPLPVARLLARLREAYPDARCALEHRDPFQLVVATVLSAQCTDQRVNLTTPALFRRYPDPASLAGADPAELEALIRPTGFFRSKARNLRGLALALVTRHGGQVPAERDLLARLPGVGPKTANVVLANAFGIPALAVDTHLFRVARRLGLASGTSPERVEAELCALFPPDCWIDLHHQLIFHGRRVCHARKPDCAACPLGALCPTGQGRCPDPHTGAPVTGPGAGSGAGAGAGPDPAPPAAAPPRLGPGPERIISLVPSVTELLVQWGLATRLVGRTAFCVQPGWIRASVPAVGGTKNPDLARILALRPDLVILERDENTRATALALAEAGLPMRVLRVRSLADCCRAYRELGAAVGLAELGQARAAALEALMERAERPERPERVALAARLPGQAGPRTLALIWKQPWMSSGPDTYIGDLLRRAGLTPIGPDGYPVLAEADLEALDPQVLLLPDEPFRFTARHQAELQRRFPRAQVRRVDGKAMTWYLSRTERGLEALMGLELT
jgi:endonuclease-3